jgi:hypothetical protein
MPVWGWVLLIACLSALAVAAVMAIVRATHRLPAEEPLHGDPANFAAPVPHHVATADELTARELDAEQSHEETRVG